MISSTLPTLSLLEARVLGVLVEKQHPVADAHLLSLNALIAGCNQQTSRNAVIEATEAEVQAAVDQPAAAVSYDRIQRRPVVRYAHNVDRVLHLSPPSVALLATLMLRGPQTAGELRINAERLHRFADIASVWRVRSRSSRCVRPDRWPWNCRAGPARARTAGRTGSAACPLRKRPLRRALADITVGELAALKANVARLEAEVASLRVTVARLCAELGVPAGTDAAGRHANHKA